MLRKLVSSCVLCLVFGSVLTAATQDKGPVPKPPERTGKIRVLIVTGGHDFEHDEFFAVFSGHPDITWKEAQQPAAQEYFAAERAGEYDVMVWYDLWQQISDESKANLVKLMNEGKPLVALHHSLANYQDWPEAIKIIGGKYHMKASAAHRGSTFKHDVNMKVKVAEPRHQITQFARDFEILDEGYNHTEVLPGVRPLLITEHADNSPMLGWTHTYGKSPVAYIQLGHDSKAYGNPAYRLLVTQAIRWAAGRLPDPSEEGFRPLFNGKDLSGWKVVGDSAGFFVKDGVIRSELPYKGEWMHTDRTYRDFILRVEWKVSAGGNSGVFVRSQEPAKGYPWDTGCEVQISNAPRDEAHCTGSLYGLVAVDPRPDETADVWHAFEIHCIGTRYKVFADNVPVIDVAGQQVEPLSKRPLEGYIGLQDNHSEKGYIEYRNIRVKEIKPEAAAGAGWQLGVQTYTFNRFSLFEAIDKARELGLKYIEAYPGQRLRPGQDGKFDPNASPEVIELVKKKLADSGIRMAAFGVVRLNNDEAATRKVFEFARVMGVAVLTAEPEPDSFDLLERLTAEFNIRVAIHNHPKPSRYWNPDTVLEAVKDRSERIGACADVGHWVRSGADPIAGLKQLEGRIISLHFKDLNKQGLTAHDVIWGTGVSDAKGMLAELNRQKFSGLFSIEYEYNWDNSVPDLVECIKFFRQVEKDLGR